MFTLLMLGHHSLYSRFYHLALGLYHHALSGSHCCAHAVHLTNTGLEPDQPLPVLCIALCYLNQGRSQSRAVEDKVEQNERLLKAVAYLQLYQKLRQGDAGSQPSDRILPLYLRVQEGHYNLGRAFQQVLHALLQCARLTLGPSLA